MLMTPVLAAMTIVAISAPPDIESIASALDDAQRQRTAHRSSYTLTRFHRCLASEADDLGAADIAEQYTIDWLSHGPRFLVTQRLKTAGEPAPVHQRMLWTGEYWLLEMTSQRSYVMRSAPTFDEHFGGAFLFHGLSGPSVLSRRPLPESIRHFPLEALEQDGSRVSMRFNIGPDKTLMGLIVDLEPQARVQEATLTLLGGPGMGDLAGQTVGRIHYWVEQWSEFGGLHLPAIAHRDGYSFTNGVKELDEPFLTRHTFERMTAEDLSDNSPDDDAFSIALNDGWVFHDDRKTLLYVVGAKSIILDDQEFRLHRPFDPVREDYRQFIEIPEDLGRVRSTPDHPPP